MSPDGKFRAEVKIRSRHVKAWAWVEKISNQVAEIYFDESQDAITPGQGCVFYDGSRVIGGGWIAKPKPQVSASV